jgi:hypothetical protein
MGVHETKNPLHSKGNGHQIKQVAFRMKENFVSYTSDKGLITRIYREFKKLTSQRINIPLNKWANELSR